MTGQRALKYAERAGLNKYYMPVLDVEIGGEDFQVYGSMSWTVAQVRSREWDDVRRAYVAVSGDEREDVDPDRARDVVSGELQKHWATYHGRDDLEEAIEHQQDKRIEMARGSSSAPRESITSTPTGEGVQKTTERRVPQRGASGMAARLIDDGNHVKSDVVKRVKEEFPDVKNVAPAVSYAARCLGVTLS